MSGLIFELEHPFLAKVIRAAVDLTASAVIACIVCVLAGIAIKAGYLFIPLVAAKYAKWVFKD